MTTGVVESSAKGADESSKHRERGRRLARPNDPQAFEHSIRRLALLNAAGVVISKRQVVRLLVAKLETFRAEDEEVLTAGLSGSRLVTVDDTGARHQGKSGFTTHVGSDRFAVFRTCPSKSRLAFLRNLLGGAARYVINEAALVYMRDNHLPQAALDKLASCATRVFPSDQEWMRRLSELGLTELTVTPDPVRVASGGAGARFRRSAGSAISSLFRTAPASSASACTRSAGSAPNGSSTS